MATILTQTGEEVQDILDRLADVNPEEIERRLAALEAGGTSLSAGKPFTNPIWGNISQRCLPDPCFWKGDDGYYYLKGTGRSYTVKRTRDFVTVEDTGRTFISASAQEWLFQRYQTSPYDGYPHIWAPQVIKINRTWVLYITVVPRNNEDSQRGLPRIVALTSRTPYGNFADPVEIVVSDSPDAASGQFISQSGVSVKCTEIIDSYVYYDNTDECLYMLAGSSDRVRRFELAPDGLSLRSNIANHVAGQTLTSSPDRDTVCEGSYLYARPHGGTMYYYLFCSTGDYSKPNYRVVYGRSTKQNGQTEGTLSVFYKNKAGGNMRNGAFEVLLSSDPANFVYTDEGAPFIEKNSAGEVISNPGKLLWGPGHVAGIIEGNDGRTFIIYHCHYATGTNDRGLCIQEVFWDDDGWPYCENNGHPVREGTVSQILITDSVKIG